jgi:hypothetical protein
MNMWIFPINKIYNAKDFWQDKSPRSEDQKWISSFNMGAIRASSVQPCEIEKGLFHQVCGDEIPLDHLTRWKCPGLLKQRDKSVRLLGLQQDKSSRSEGLKGFHPHRPDGNVPLFFKYKGMTAW